MINKRIAIKKILEEEFPVYHIGILEKEAQLSLPFVILEMTGERHIMRSRFVTFSVFIYAPIKSPFILDESEKKVRKLLHNKRIESYEGAFFVECTGSSLDFINSNLNAKMGAVGKVIEFKIPVLDF